MLSERGEGLTLEGCSGCLEGESSGWLEVPLLSDCEEDEVLAAEPTIQSPRARGALNTVPIFREYSKRFPLIIKDEGL